jgi:hypothetical protein
MPEKKKDKELSEKELKKASGAGSPYGDAARSKSGKQGPFGTAGDRQKGDVGTAGEGGPFRDAKGGKGKGK